MRYLGIDYGAKKIGLAFGDDGSKVAVPMDVIANTGADSIKKIIRRIESEEIEAVVVGIPLPTVEAVGTRHALSLQRVRDWIKTLQAEISVPVHEIDERYTTAEAIRLQREEGAEASDDALAAMLVLQAFLDQP